jgi:hypothetical protein
MIKAGSTFGVSLSLLLLLAAASFAWNGCGGDSVIVTDGGRDSGVKDAGQTDADFDAESPDAYEPSDASEDASEDAGSFDASDGGGTGDAGKADGGDAGLKDAGTADAGKPGVITPGVGVQLWTTDSTKQTFNVMSSKYKNLTDALGAGTPDSNIQYYIRWNKYSIDGFFINPAGGDTVVDDSLLNQIVIRDQFNGRTAAGHGLGTSRTDWQSEMGTANHSASSGGSTVDLYFKTGAPAKKGGLSVVYDGSGNATQVSVFKETKQIPGSEIAWDVPSVFDITSSLTGGTPFGSVTTKFGTPDIDSTKTISSVEVRNLSYMQLGLTFSGAKSVGTVATTTIIAPYFGTLKYGSIALGSLHSDVTTFFGGQTRCCNTADDCKTKVKCTENTYPFEYGGKTVTVYYYRVKQETVVITDYYINVGFIYSDTTDQATVILLGFPVKK